MASEINCGLSAEEIAVELGSDINAGLSIEKAHGRIHSRGRNEIRFSRVKKTFVGVRGKIFSFMNVVLLLMAAIHMISEGSEGLALSLCLVVCAVINSAASCISFRRDGTVYSAAEAAQNQTVRVVRSGIEKEIGAALLAQGDVVFLKKGQTVPADAKIIKCSSLVVDESILNGEGSAAAKFDCGEGSDTLLYMGTKILEGSVKAIITAVGDKTQLGNAASELEREPSKISALEKRTASIGSFCGAAAAVMWVAAFVIRLLRGFGAVSALDNSISAAMTAIPVSLSAILLITMSLDVFVMRKKGVEIGSVSALEAMGATTVLCVGKRGTVTETGFTVAEVCPGKGFDENTLRLFAAMCTTGDISDGKPAGDAMQTALIKDAVAHGHSADEIRNSAPLERVLDNRSSARLMTTVHKTDSGYTVICKGSADAALSRCSYIYDNGIRRLDPQKDIAAVVGEVRSMTEKELTVIGVAYKDVNDLDGDLQGGMTFIGLIGLGNPVRGDSASAVEELNSMGVKLCMITDDNLTSVSALAEECGIERDFVYRGSDVTPDSLSRIRKNTAFADTPVSMKAELVGAINSGRENAAFVGRSAKDIGAMSAAEVSISTDAGARVCSSAADVRLHGSGLAGIAAALRECKRAYINNARLTDFLLSCNAAEMLCALIALVMGYSTPFTPFEIIWLNAIIAVAGAVGIWREPYCRPLMTRRISDRGTKKKGFPRFIVAGAVSRGIVTGVCAMLMYASLIGFVGSAERRTAVFLMLGVSFVLMAQSCRSDEPIIKRLKLNITAIVCLLIGAAAVIFGAASMNMAAALGIASNLNPSICAAAVVTGVIPALATELYKLIKFGKGKH